MGGNRNFRSQELSFPGAKVQLSLPHLASEGTKWCHCREWLQACFMWHISTDKKLLSYAASLVASSTGWKCDMAVNGLK